MFVERIDRANRRLAIFVHGWRGGHLSTWGDLAKYLERHADEKLVLEDWDYLFLGYETYSLGSLLDIARIVAGEWMHAAGGRPPFNHAYQTLALVGHSLGTLGIRQLLCAVSEHPEGMLRALRCALLFGSPLNGSPLASYAAAARIADAIKGRWGALLPGSYQINDALQPDGQILRMLQVWNETFRLSASHRDLRVKVILGADDQVVHQGGLARWSGDVRRETSLDHTRLCKVKYNGTKTVGLILDELVGELR
ncbi:esterase/lipase family protein [Bradyrhizobium tropiciagri]|uniref:esterase/lipase family protein n=1 Tax=Bradyrhizobium tropiciagri TaxID=312253 RepID=UPI00067E0CDB|nr:hypothetical protein [Bradyrhizobium tropiciagri]